MPNRIRSKAPLRAEPNLVPMLDVVLQLIVFFMMLVHFGTRLEGASLAVRLPSAPVALPGGEFALDRLLVVIDERGRLLDSQSRPIDPAAETTWWADQSARRRAGLKLLGEPDPAVLPTLVILRADRLAPFGAVKRVLATAQVHGFTRFTFVVLREGV